MKSVITLIFLIIISSRTVLAQNFNSQEIYDSYHLYKENIIKNKRIKHSDLVKKLKQIKKNKVFDVQVAGKSLEGKEIYHLSIGQGKTNILLWSQMHGDESTATMALLDIFNFFEADDGFNNFKNNLLKKIKIHFIPMLNPDGAEKFTRRNALDIDLNRDARRLLFPESKILKSLRDELDPVFAFNLHDQNSRYTSGNSYHSATISFLAPAYNYEKEINNVRRNTMKLISDIYVELNKYIPGHIGKYKDDYEPRAFGDSFMKWGTGSVLIESGGWKNDEEKQFIRKLNYISILSGLNSIAKKLYKKADINIYHDIPFNDNLLFDLLLKNVSIKYRKKFYKVDVGINREELTTIDKTQAYYSGKIEDWGDLSVFFGYDEFDLDGYEIRNSKIYDVQLHNINELDYNKILRGGFGFVRIDSLSIQREFASIPFNIILKDGKVNLEPKYNEHANFTIWKNNKLYYNVINGFIYDVNADLELQNNGLIFK